MARCALILLVSLFFRGRGSTRSRPVCVTPLALGMMIASPRSAWLVTTCLDPRLASFGLAVVVGRLCS